MGKVKGAAAEPIKALLLHLGMNMWWDRDVPGAASRSEYKSVRPYLRFDTKVWNELVRQMVDAGLNMLVIDLGEGVKYESHPELAVRGSWTTKRLERELGKLRELGLEPIPKLNFSACHDAWLGPYARMVSTDTYYGVCRDLIAEVIDLFDTPRLFHLGMDEETCQHQRQYEYVVVRQYDLWWKDLLFLVEQVERAGSRAWVWSDYVWHHPDEFFKKMPRSVLQSNWYYGTGFSRKEFRVQAYLDLEKHRYDQVPTGSNWANDVNFERTVRFCSRHISPKRLLGFLQTAWQPTVQRKRPIHLEAIEQAGRALAKWEARSGKLTAPGPVEGSRTR